MSFLWRQPMFLQAPVNPLSSSSSRRAPRRWRPPLPCCPNFFPLCVACHPLPHGALHNVQLVLVGSQHAGNVGSACRAAANFECQDIRLVDPSCDHLTEEGRKAACNPVSRQLLQEVRVTESLLQALDDCSMAVAFTRRTGKIRRPSLTLAELKVPEDPNLRLALVFGREDCGLHTHELLHCTHVCTIPSGSWEGSLNVSHAVAVVLSRLYEACASNQDHDCTTLRHHSITYKTLPGTATVSEMENLLHRWENIFMICNQTGKLVGNPEYKTPEKLFMFLRKLLQRARPSVREVSYLHGYLTVIEFLAAALRQDLKNIDSTFENTR